MSTIKASDLLRLSKLFCNAATEDLGSEDDFSDEGDVFAEPQSGSSPDNDFELIGVFHTALPIKGNLKGKIEQITADGKMEYVVHKSNVSDQELENGEGKKCSFILGYIGSNPVAILTRFLE